MQPLIHSRKPTRKDSSNLLLVAMLLIPALIGCSSNLDQEDYVAWVESYDNKLHVTKTVGTYRFDLQHQPAEYIYLQRGGVPDTKGQFRQAAVREIANMQYYTLTIGLADSKIDFLDYGAATYADKQAKLYYFSYTFPQDIYLEENNVKLQCQLFHFERSYDLKPSRTFVLGFENPFKDSATATLVIQSPWIPAETIALQVDKKDIPRLKQ